MQTLKLILALIVLGSGLLSAVPCQADASQFNYEQEYPSQRQTARVVVIDRWGLTLASVLRHLLAIPAAPHGVRPKSAIRPSLWTDPYIGAFGAHLAFSF